MVRQVSVSLTWLLALALLGLAGCEVKTTVRVTPAANDSKPDAASTPAATGGAVTAQRPAVSDLAPTLAPPTPQEQYEAALLRALDLLADRKPAEALTAFEAAQKLQDTPLVRQEIDRVRNQLAQQAALDRTVQDIRVVLEGGQADEANRLITAALAHYGSGDAVDQLLKLKRQADALAVAAAGAGTAATRWQRELETALKENNLRAAATVYEQLQAANATLDPVLKQRVEQVRVTVAKYDDSRRRALELRRDPGQLEDALALCQEAARAWDTPQIRQDIADLQLALSQRRERLSVVEFETRGDVGIPAVGLAVADEMLPHFRRRFDLVERGQLKRIIDELKLTESGLTDDPAGRREVGRLANVKYLVVGSVSGLGGITVHARLVDVKSGLIVQTARVHASSQADLIRQLPHLATMLMMSDEEKQAFEDRLNRQAAPPPPVAVVAADRLPPMPTPAADPAPLPPLVTTTRRYPEFGTLRPDDFLALPPRPAAGVAITTPTVAIQAELPLRERLFAVQLELGDNLLRRGRFREAQVHFNLCRDLFPDRREIWVRIDTCRPHVPPPTVIVQPVIRERLAFLNFPVMGDPRIAPPWLSTWTPEQMAPYFCPPFDVIDRGELFWHMGRLGLTFGDVVHNPAARRWLARALNVRYFVGGGIQQQGPGLLVTTHLIDGEFGFEVGRAQMLVQNPQELKLRLAELARLTLLAPAERQRLEQERLALEAELVRAQQALERRQFSVAVQICTTLRGRYPMDVRIGVLAERADEMARLAALEAARAQELARQAALAAEAARREAELALLAETARSQVVININLNLNNDARRLERERQKQVAFDQLIVQARAASSRLDFGAACQFYESAIALRPDETAMRELAVARVKLQQGLQAAARVSQPAVIVQQRRQAELAAARAALEREQREREQQLAALQAAAAQRDQAEYTRLLDEAQRLMARDQLDAAIASLQAAKRLRRTDEVERLLSDALMAQAKRTAAAKGERERQELEAQLAREVARRQQAEIEAARNRQLYEEALAAARQALDRKQYAAARTKFNEAGKLYRTDVVLAGLKAIDDAETQARLEAEAARKAEAERLAKERAAKGFADRAKAAEQAKNFDEAVKLYQQAAQADPLNQEWVLALSKAEAARDRAALEIKLKREDQEKQARVKRLRDEARRNLTAKRFDAALLLAQEADKLAAGDAQTAALLKEITDGKAAAKAKQEANERALAEAEAKAKAASDARAAELERQAKARAEAEERLRQQVAERKKAAEDAARQKEEERLKALASDKNHLIAEARAALAAKDFTKAADFVRQAVRAAPTDPEVGKLQRELQQAQQQARAEQKKAEDLAKAKADTERAATRAAYDRAMQAGKAALSGKRYDEAVAQFKKAQELMPKDADAAFMLGIAESTKKSADETAQKEAAEKAEAEFARAIQRGKQALEGRRYDDAVEAFALAAQLRPSNAEAKNLLAEARTQRQQALSKPASKPGTPDAATKRRIDALVAQGRSHFLAKKYDEAIKSFEEALKLNPDDEAIKKSIDNVRAAQQAPAEQAKRQNVARLNNQGRAFLLTKKWAEAEKAYREALALDPDNAAAQQGLKDVEAAKAAAEKSKADDKPAPPKKPDDKPASPPTKPGDKPSSPPGKPGAAAEYERQMKLGADFEKQNKLVEAAAAYLKALQAKPSDTKATEALNNVRYLAHIDTGKKALAAKKNAEAAKSFEEALKLKPKDPEATRLLRQAAPGRP
jgi:tetratricopeptide (TPR) repeat protein